MRSPWQRWFTQDDKVHQRQASAPQCRARRVKQNRSVLMGMDAYLLRLALIGRSARNRAPFLAHNH